MNQVKSISGVQFKLESSKGSLLGSVTIPHDWADILQYKGCVQFMMGDPFPLWCTEIDLNELTYRQGAISKGHKFDNSVIIFGVSLEEFETCDGCSFSPGAAYIRSIVT